MASFEDQVTIYFISGERLPLKGIEAEAFLRRYADSGTQVMVLEEREWLAVSACHVLRKKMIERRNIEHIYSEEYY